MTVGASVFVRLMSCDPLPSVPGKAIRGGAGNVPGRLWANAMASESRPGCGGEAGGWRGVPRLTILPALSPRYGGVEQGGPVFHFRCAISPVRQAPLGSEMEGPGPAGQTQHQGAGNWPRPRCQQGEREGDPDTLPFPL